MRKSLAVILLVHLFLYIAIGLNIFFLRQIISFVYLSFIPGFVLLKILKLKETSVIDTILFSAGLSIAFSMFLGLLINWSYPILGISQPLSTVPLVVTQSVLMLILLFVSHRQDLSEDFSSIGSNFINLKVPITKSAILVLLILSSIIGALYVSAPIVSIPVLLLMITMTASLFAVVGFSNKYFSKWYPLVIFAISIALAFQILFTSKYHIGYDVQLEYYVFKQTVNNGYWHFLPVGAQGTTLEYSVYNSMLSITILPAIYSAFLNINGEILFKTLYPFVFSLVPVALYRIYERQIGKSSSLLSTFFFISSPIVFYGVESLSLNRQIVAEFFLVLSILIFLDKKISVGKRRLLLIVFGAAMVVSHYSTTYIYLVFIFSTYLLSKIKGESGRILDYKTVFLLFAMTYLWDIISVGQLIALTESLNRIFSNFLADLLNPVSRVSTGFGSRPVSTFVSMTNWALFLIVHFFIAIGILLLMFKPAKTKLDPKYVTLAILSAVVVVLCFAVPNFAPILNFSRFYAIALLFLAPCFVLGGETLLDISENVLKRVTSRRFLSNTHNQIRTVLLCTVLVGYFLSQSGFINFVTGDSPASFSLDYNRISTSSNVEKQLYFHGAYIMEQDVFSAVWLSKNKEESSVIYADRASRSNVLTSYGLIPRQQIGLLTNITVLQVGGYIYLGQLNVVNGIISQYGPSFNTSEIYPLLNRTNLIYSNGNSEIWYTSSPG